MPSWNIEYFPGAAAILSRQRATAARLGLSRTLTPVIIGLLLKGEHHDGAGGSGNVFALFHQAFEHRFELLKRRVIVPIVVALMLALGGVMLAVVGRDFFPRH